MRMLTRLFCPWTEHFQSSSSTYAYCHICTFNREEIVPKRAGFYAVACTSCQLAIGLSFQPARGTSTPYQGFILSWGGGIFLLISLGGKHGPLGGKHGPLGGKHGPLGGKHGPLGGKHGPLGGKHGPLGGETWTIGGGNMDHWGGNMDHWGGGTWTIEGETWTIGGEHGPLGGEHTLVSPPQIKP